MWLQTQTTTTLLCNLCKIRQAWVLDEACDKHRNTYQHALQTSWNPKHAHAKQTWHKSMHHPARNKHSHNLWNRLKENNTCHIRWHSLLQELMNNNQDNRRTKKFTSDSSHNLLQHLNQSLTQFVTNYEKQKLTEFGTKFKSREFLDICFTQQLKIIGTNCHNIWKSKRSLI